MPLERPVTLSLLAAIALTAAPAGAGAQPPAAAPLSDLASLDARLGELSRQVAPSVVQVLASGYTTAPNALLARAGSSGSGVIVDAEGQLDVNLYRRVPGDTVMISAKRGGETLVVPVVVVERPARPARSAGRPGRRSSLASGRFGWVARPEGPGEGRSPAATPGLGIQRSSPFSSWIWPAW